MTRGELERDTRTVIAYGLSMPPIRLEKISVTARVFLRDGIILSIMSVFALRMTTHGSVPALIALPVAAAMAFFSGDHLVKAAVYSRTFGDGGRVMRLYSRAVAPNGWEGQESSRPAAAFFLTIIILYAMTTVPFISDNLTLLSVFFFTGFITTDMDYMGKLGGEDD